MQFFFSFILYTRAIVICNKRLYLLTSILTLERFPACIENRPDTSSVIRIWWKVMD